MAMLQMTPSQLVSKVFWVRLLSASSPVTVDKQEIVHWCQIRQVGQVVDRPDAVGGDEKLNGGSNEHRSVIPVKKTFLAGMKASPLPEFFYEPAQGSHFEICIDRVTPGHVVRVMTAAARIICFWATGVHTCLYWAWLALLHPVEQLLLHLRSCGRTPTRLS